MAQSIDIDKLKGRFEHCLFKTDNYAVWKFRDEYEGLITVTGNLIDISKDIYTLYGKYNNHIKYGIQFNVSYYEKELPNDYDGVVLYLASPLFNGVGKKTALKIAKELGDDALNKIKDDPTILDELKISKKAKLSIKNVLSSNLEFEDSFFYLVSTGISIDKINLIVSRYKENTKILLEDNPYLPYYDIYSIGFNLCNEIANKINFPKDNPKRYVAFIHHLATDYFFKSGDTYITYEQLKKLFYKNNIDYDFDLAISKAIEDRKIIIENEKYYTDNSFKDEVVISNFLNYHNEDINYDINVIKKDIKTMEKRSGIFYDAEQIQAITNFFKTKISLIIGGPGTGKTTIIKAITELIIKNDQLSNLYVVAPTGRASKRINELCNVETSTIHALLKWDKESNTFVYNENNPLNVDYLIIDEFSMVDNWLFSSLCKALNNIKRICIIGDDNQLPSVGAGNLLADLINSDIFNITRLKNIHRQKDGSSIIDLCNEVISENVDFDKYQDEVCFIDDEEFVMKEAIINGIKNNLIDGYDLNDIEVLSPMYKGGLGIDVLNILLQNVFNGEYNDNTYKNKYRTLKVNDKIIQLKNQRDDNVFNGDIGKIIEIENDNDNVTILCKFDDMIVSYTKEAISNISLAYAISVHKAQGSEYPIVYFAFSNSHIHMLNKNLIYTAISRASNKLIIIGSKDVFLKGIKKEMTKRNTTLSLRLANLL